MAIILEKRDLLATKTALVQRLGKIKIKTKTELRLAQHDLDQLQRSYGILREIYKLRKSPDITNKIYRNLPLEPRNMHSSPTLMRRSRDLIVSNPKAGACLKAR